MRLVKATLFSVIGLLMLFLWTSRGYVAAAYSTDEGTDEIRLSGVDLEITKTPIGESPYVVEPAEDTRRKPMAVLFTEQEVEEEPVIEMTDGEATIQGSATGPDGPAFGGIVRLERHTVDGVGKLDARVNAAGGWGLNDLPGGRYRIRAWLPGRATMASSEVLFVEDDGVIDLDFVLEEVDPEPVLEFVDGGVMYEGLTGTVGVAVTQRVVDADGLILVTPIPGATLSMQTSSEVSLASGPIALTDQDGVARFTLRCERVGAGNMIVRYGLITMARPLPGCRPIPPPPPPVVPVQPEGDLGNVPPTSSATPATPEQNSNDGSGQ